MGKARIGSQFSSEGVAEQFIDQKDICLGGLSLSKQTSNSLDDSTCDSLWRLSRTTRELHKLIEFELSDLTGSVLDVGCGVGVSTKICERRFSSIFAIDILNVFEKKRFEKNIRFLVGDGLNLPFKRESFDVVISLDVLEHVPDDTRFLQESYRVLKKWGPAILLTPNRERLSNRLRQILGRKITYPFVLSRHPTLGNFVHLREYSKRELYSLGELVAFRTVEVKGAIFGLLFKRPLEEVVSVRMPWFLEKWSQYLLMHAIK